MEQGLQKIQEVAKGLLYRSESDYPFELVYVKITSAALVQELVSLSNKDIDAKVEQVTLEYFLEI